MANQPILAMFNMPGVTAAQYDHVMQELAATGVTDSPGSLFHVGFPTADGWMVIDVYESGAVLENFAPILMPILAKVGITPPQPQVYPVHNMMK